MRSAEKSEERSLTRAAFVSEICVIGCFMNNDTR
jgi:hypothetical protein